MEAESPRKTETNAFHADASPAAVHALAAAIDARDSYAAGRSEQVVGLASSVAMLLGLTADTVERIAPEEVSKAAAAIAVMTYAVAEMPERLPR